ncbi:FemAB family XrtA/PEP-CTERM system-associated protein [Salinisphaera aquimarina]|uniref:FemAB family XrtA/PEP-CTERM system-associated protein n=1 Tax=Salinisphaera aquimarina TaxID=2094031 RepID=A0ABV7ETJ1_9GAMM
MSLTVRELESSDYARWDAFVAEQETATFFHRIGWKRVIEKAFGHRCPYLYVEADGEIVGVLPLVHVNSRLFANALISTPFCVYGGALACSADVSETLYAAARERGENLGVDYAEFRERDARHPDWPRKDLYYTFRKTLADNDDENLQAIPRKQRAVVRKALKNGMTVEFDADVDRFYPLYALTLRNLGTPIFAKRFLTLLKEEFGDDCEIMTIVHDNQPVASVLSFYFRDEVLPYYAGAGESARDLKANDFMYWALMSHAVEKGMRIFDFGRSKKGTGPFQFKRHWGFEPEPLNYEYVLIGDEQMPDLSPANPRYQRKIRLWQKLPVAVTRVIGPVLARNLG